MMPETRAQLTDRDRDILGTLALKVRILTAEQAARTWWPEAIRSRAAAIRRLGQLVRSGHLKSVERLTRPECSLVEPLARWRPCRPSPPLTQISTCARARHRGQPALTRLYSASKGTSLGLAGVRIRPVRSSETSHDVHLAAVYLRYRLDQPRMAAKWVAEWTIPELLGPRRKPNDKIPDAALISGPRVTAIEFVGTYSTAKLEAFHAYCEARRYAYELW